MPLLAIDTSLAACSVAFWRDDEVMAERFEAMERGHAEALMPMIAGLCAAMDVAPGRIDAFAVTRGPGTFTGIRVGLAAARGLALVSGAPIVGVSTLATVAASAGLGPGPSILVVQNARRAEVYAELLGPQPRGPVLLRLADLAATFPERPLRLVGSGAVAAAGVLSGETLISATDVLPRAAALARLGASALTSHPVGVPMAPPTPLYLRAPDAKLPS